MAESPSWRERLAEARQRAVFEPTPSGATPHVARVDTVVEMLDTVEVLRSTAGPDTPTQIICHAVALLLREHINSRLYAENMRARIEVEPNATDAIWQQTQDTHKLLQALAAALLKSRKEPTGG